MHPLISNHGEEIASLCRQFGVRRLELFSSILRDDFAKNSGIDIVVEFSPYAGVREYFELKAKLEELFGRRVDLVELSSMESTRLRRIIERSKVPIYAASA